MNQLYLGAGGNVGHLANGGDRLTETTQAINKTYLQGLTACVYAAFSQLAHFVLGHFAACGHSVEENLVEVEDVFLDEFTIFRLHVAMTAAEERAIAAFDLGEIDVHAIEHGGLVGENRENADGASQRSRLGKDESSRAGD